MIEEIIKFENGELDKDETIKLFSELVKSGLAWKLQGSYGRFATQLIEAEYINNNGDILQ